MFAGNYFAKSYFAGTYFPPNSSTFVEDSASIYVPMFRPRRR